MAKKNETTATTENKNQEPQNITDTAKQPEKAKTSENSATKGNLENLAVLADRHRIPAWQEAALCRFMGWADDKMVTNADYVDALDKLKTRRIGGGRA